MESVPPQKEWFTLQIYYPGLAKGFDSKYAISLEY